MLSKETLNYSISQAKKFIEGKQANGEVISYEVNHATKTLIKASAVLTSPESRVLDIELADCEITYSINQLINEKVL